MPNQILFLCTGNYYRSRFAEIVFNALASERGLDWVADSCGLSVGTCLTNVGAISSYTLRGLAARGIAPTNHTRMPRALQENDLAQSQRVIALNRAEHLPYMQEQFPAWANRIEYWHVSDLDQSSAEDALAKIERQVHELIEELAR
jgi:protein-tyrosine phosphatase